MPKSKIARLIGKRFGRLLVIADAGGTRWLCRCDCGNERTVRTYALTSGNTRSCGCGMVDARFGRVTKLTHGKSKSRVYRIWAGMLARCTNPNATGYHKYGARGVTVCDRWRESFENFYADMGDPPTSAHQIERKRNARGYEPGNCEWATTKTQALNRSSTHWITFNGATMCLSDWARTLGVTQSCLTTRLQRWSFERAMTTGPKSASVTR